MGEPGPIERLVYDAPWDHTVYERPDGSMFVLVVRGTSALFETTEELTVDEVAKVRRGLRIR